MASQLTAIVAAIKALAPTYDGKAISVRDGSTIPQTPAVADLPMRLITANGNSGGLAVRKTLGSGTVLHYRWTITDLMLGQQVGLSRGVKDQSNPMIQYAADYVQLARTLITGTWQMDDVAITMGTEEFPVESGTYFHVVRCEYTIREIIQ
jgi:hypothetical protein